MKDETTRRVIPVVALLVLIGALIYSLLPFKVAGVVECGPALLGAEPRSSTSVGLVRPGPACDQNGNSRLVSAGIVAVLAVVGGGAALMYPYLAPGEGRRTRWPFGGG